jgi:hypothetical protein
VIEVSAVREIAANPPSTVPEVPTGRPRTDRRPGVEALLQAEPGGQLMTSLSALACSDAPSALDDARRALAGLDAADYELHADVRQVAPCTTVEITWTPVTAVVDLMLDWDILDLEITVAELAEWLDVDVVIPSARCSGCRGTRASRCRSRPATTASSSGWMPRAVR